MAKKYCPTCGSTNVERYPWPILGTEWYCKDCKTIMSAPFTKKQRKWLVKKLVAMAKKQMNDAKKR